MTQTGFWWILLSLAMYGLIHSVLASVTVKERVAAKLGKPVYQRYYRLFFSLQAFFLFLPILALAAFLPDRVIYHIPQPWIWLTVAVQLAAVFLLLDSINQTGALRFIGFAQALQMKQGSQKLPLVERGMYRYVRHPIYTNMFVIMWLMPVMSWNLLALAIGVSIYNVIGATLEERKLHQEFGPAYAAYRKTTPFMLPRLRLTKPNGE